MLKTYYYSRNKVSTSHNSGHAATLHSTQIRLRRTSHVRKTLYDIHFCYLIFRAAFHKMKRERKNKKCYTKQDMETNKLNPDSQLANSTSLNNNFSFRQSGLSKLVKLLTASLIVLFFGSTIFFAYKYYGVKQKLDSQRQALLSPSPTISSPSPILSPTAKKEQKQAQTPTSPVVEEVSLSDIKYTLPSGWVAEIRSKQNDLFLSPKEEGGYLAIKVLPYDGKTGRRAYYCQITNHCIKATYFTKMKIGNIYGYRADALDNSGGGAEYFGAKGDKFYIIYSFSPSYPHNNFFDQTYQEVLDSLVF